MKKKTKVKKRLKLKLNNKKNYTKEIKDYMINIKDFKIQTKTMKLITLKINMTLCNNTFIMQLKIKLLTGRVY